MNKQLILRNADPADAPALAILSGQLGYPSDADAVSRRLALLLSREGHAVFLAETQEHVIGWAHVFAAYRVDSDPFAELGGLVVADTFRGTGVGRRLVDLCNLWAQTHRFPQMRVRSNVVREDAHGFYRHLGFIPVKSQAVFSLMLPPAQ
jgi:GNAT superfamily N-acetyltransferase